MAAGCSKICAAKGMSRSLIALIIQLPARLTACGTLVCHSLCVVMSAMQKHECAFVHSTHRTASGLRLRSLLTVEEGDPRGHSCAGGWTRVSRTQPLSVRRQL
jgi:hypothetical protein